MTDRRTSMLYTFLSLVLIAGVTAARYWFIISGQLNLHADEAQYWDWSRTLQWSYYSKGPLIALMNWVGTQFYGPTELGVRVGSLAVSVLMQLAVLGWVGGCLNRARTAFWALFILNTTLLFMAGSILMTTDSPLLLCWILGLICLHRAMDGGGLWAHIALGLLLALGIAAKYTMLMFVPLAIIAALWSSRREPLPQRFWPRLLKSQLLGVVLGLAPILVWNFQNDWVGVKHVLYRGAMVGAKAEHFFTWKHLPEYLGSQVAVLTPWWFVFLLVGAWIMLGRIFARPAPVATDEAGEPLPAPPVWPSHSVAVLLTVFFWPVWIFFLVWSVHTKVEANWSATAYPAGVLMAALAVEGFLHRVPRPRWAATWPVLGVVLFAAVHLHGFIPAEIPGNPAKRLIGWKDLGLQVEQAVAELGATDEIFVFADEYGVTAELSFYVPGQRRAYCLAGERKMNQYDLWPGPDQTMKNAVFVAKGEESSVSERVTALFENVDAPRVISTREGGRTGQTFTIYLCRGYKGQWPVQEGKTF